MRTMLLLGTKKGAFILDGDQGRREWSIRGPHCAGWPIHDVIRDPADGSILAAGGSPWYGPAVWRSRDDGETWSHSSEGLTYGDDGPAVVTTWSLAAGHGALFAGVEPAGLFRSDDHGSTWQHVEGLTNHPSRPTWEPGNGGLILHSIIPHPADPMRAWVAISAVGTFATEDGGESWEARNRGVRADFNPDPAPVTGQCVHRLVAAAGEPLRLYQQNHCGVYRSDDAGSTWTEITAGLPSQFGFPMVAHPRERETAWVIPLDGDSESRLVPEGRAAVWRTHDGGDTWVRSGEGLPQHNAYVSVLRQALAVDSLDPVGVYFGTSTGQLYGSTDEGRSWSLLADHLPPIWSVQAIALP
jgi:photosystem II stability/assembly factor-like uncharacterized protein